MVVKDKLKNYWVVNFSVFWLLLTIETLIY